MENKTAGGHTQEPMSYIQDKRNALNDALESASQEEVNNSAKEAEYKFYEL